MSDSNPSHSVQKVVHPLELLKPEWEVSQYSTHSGDFIVRHDVEPASEIDAPPISHHILSVVLKSGTRQTTQLGKQQFDGIQQKGDGWIYPVGMEGKLIWDDTDEEILFILAPQFLQRVALETGCLNPDQVELKPAAHIHDAKLETIALDVCMEMQLNKLGSKLYFESLSNQLAIHLLRHYCAFEPVFRAYSDGLSHTALRGAIAYIHDHLNQKLSLEEVAQSLNLSVYYFCTLFTQSMGISPYQYVLQQRVELAKQILKTTSHSLSEVATLCGFNDQAQMNRHFRKFTGVTPKTYRNG